MSLLFKPASLNNCCLCKLLEAAAFTKAEPDVLTNYTARYNESLSLLKQLSEGKNRQDMYRTEQARYEVKW